jgi:hydrogenase nickel incorporation protein HypA/HybF
MHELSFAQSIIEIAGETAADHGMSHITAVELEIGSISGIEIDALEFGWEIVTKNTIAEGSRLQITSVRAIGKCNQCGKEFEITGYLSDCPECNSIWYDILQGKEMKLVAIVAE